jgi:hypothetical protein
MVCLLSVWWFSAPVQAGNGERMQSPMMGRSNVAVFVLVMLPGWNLSLGYLESLTVVR